MEDFNNEAEFEAQIEPLMKELLSRARALNIPIICVAISSADRIGTASIKGMMYRRLQDDGIAIAPSSFEEFARYMGIDDEEEET